MKKTIISLIIGLIFSSSIAYAKDNSVQELKFAEYNIENLFDGIQNEGKLPEKAKPEEQLIALAKAIKELNADVLAVVEVETQEVLDNFVKKYMPDSGYRSIVIEGNDKRGIDVGILTRLPVLDIKSHKNAVVNIPGEKSTVLSRDLLQVRIKANENYIFTVFVTHLKSKHGGEVSDIRREAEAETIRKIISDFVKENPKENYIFTGDFNDFYNSKPLQPVLNSNLGLTDIIHRDLGSNEYVYTYHPQKYRSRLDYILISPTMMKEYIDKSVYIHKAPDIDPDKAIFFDASDHLPISLKFDVRKDY